MNNKEDVFFDQNEFDIHEPLSGHLKRFEQKLKGKQRKKQFSWTWMSIAALVILSIGFGLGNMTQTSYDLANVSPKMAETQNFFVNAIQVDLIELEKNRNLETEKIVESALDQLEQLEDEYKSIIKDLKKTGQQSKIINEMIQNYQQRLEVLKFALQQIETVKSNKNLNDEIFI